MAVAVLGALHGCNRGPVGWQTPRSIDLGAGSNLHSVVAHGIGHGSAGTVAVGSAGTVLAWTVNYGDEFNSEPVVETSTLTDVELRGVTDLANGAGVIDAGDGRWVVVGDGGFAAVTNNSGETWTTLDLGTSADLHAVFAVDDSVVVAGDEVVRVLEADDMWLEPANPQVGWGQLRAGVSLFRNSDDPRTYVVGLGGAIASTTDPSAVWVAEDSGVDVDLFGVGHLGETVAAVGANGTFLVREAGEWSPIETERTTDFVDYLNFDPFGVVLAADGELLHCNQYDLSEGFQHLERIEGARDLVAQPTNIGLIVVGDAGLAVSIDYVWPGGY
jgi:hypothetical protein